MPFTAKSHYIVLKPIGIELARRGHNVTVITGHKDPNPPPNYHQVLIDSFEIWDVIGGERPNVFDMVNIMPETFFKHVLCKGGIALTEVTLNSTEVRTLLTKDNKFDLVISEQFFQEATNVLAYKYNAPLVLITTFGNCMKHNIVNRNPLQLATILAEYVSVRDPTSFWGRLRNFYYILNEYIYWRYKYLEEQENLVRKYFPDLPKPVPSLYDLQTNASLILINGHFSLDAPVAYLPNIIEIGGAHLTDTNNKLPQDLQQILDNAKHGVVYMNFGSNVRSVELPDEKKNAIINVFRKLKQTVLWKWEDDNLENKPENLVLRKWFPQKELLSHPNVKVFISHGGLIGMQEAIFYGVPIVGVPIYGDQFNNLLQAQNLGFGKILEYHDINEKSFGKILNEVLNDNVYLKNAKAMSARFKDRPMRALDTAMYWIEYVIRNNGADYLRNPALELNWIAYNMLDVYGFILIVIITNIYALYKLMKWLVKITVEATNIKKTENGKKNL